MLASVGQNNAKRHADYSRILYASAWGHAHLQRHVERFDFVLLPSETWSRLEQMWWADLGQQLSTHPVT